MVASPNIRGDEHGAGSFGFNGKIIGTDVERGFVGDEETSDADLRERAMRKALERRRKADSKPQARGWYKRKHKTITKGQKRAIERNWAAFGVGT